MRADGLRGATLQCAGEAERATCNVRFECVECRITAAEAAIRFVLTGRFAFAHALHWHASVHWSASEPIAGLSALGNTLPHVHGYVLRGGEASEVTLALVPTVYLNTINRTEARGFRLQYIASSVGSLTAAEELARSRGGGQIVVAIRMQPVAQEYTIVVSSIKALLDVAVQIMVCARSEPPNDDDGHCRCSARAS